MINFHDGWVNKSKRLGDGNDSNKTKSTKKRKKTERKKKRGEKNRPSVATLRMT